MYPPIPKNTKSYYIYDFYVLEYVMRHCRHSMIGFDKWHSKMEVIEKEFLTMCRNEQLRVLEFSCAAELRHGFDCLTNNQVTHDWKTNVKHPRAYEFCKMFKNHFSGVCWLREEFTGLKGRACKHFNDCDIERQEAYHRFTRFFDGDIDELMLLAKAAFLGLSWEASFGGEQWADVAQAWFDLRDVKWNGLYNQMDHIFDLQHNTSTIFNKVSSYAEDLQHKKQYEYDWIDKALKSKATAKSPWVLWKFCSPTMKRFAAPALKATGHGTYEFYVRWHTKCHNQKTVKKMKNELQKLKNDYKKCFRCASIRVCKPDLIKQVQKLETTILVNTKEI